MQRRRAITFDFHDTLATCDRWFDLEVRSLPALVLERLSPADIWSRPIPSGELLTSTYRALRAEIIDHGVELDALAGVVETYQRLGLNVDQAPLADAVEGLMREALIDVRPKPGAIDTVTTLHEAGFTLGVISSAVYHQFLLWVLDEFSILPMFRTVVTSASAGFYKSRPEIYRRALLDLEVDAESTCHVGDSARWDHLMAKSLGIRTVLVTPKDFEADRGQPAPDLHLRSLVGAARAIEGVAVAAGEGTAS